MNSRVLHAVNGHQIARALCGVAVIGLILAFPQTAVSAAAFAIRNLVLISPVIVIGVVLTAAITASGSMGLIAAAFEGREIRMIGLASFIGALTPVCGASVLPLVAGLLVARVPLAPIMAFWLSSPITDPGMLAITGVTLGWPFAAAKTVSAFAIGLFGGFATLSLTRSGRMAAPIRNNGYIARIAANSCGRGVTASLKWRFWDERERVAQFWQSARDSGRLMLVWLSAAFVAEYFMKLYLPDELVASIVGHDRPWAVPLAAIAGAPIYLDGYAALPLIRGLMDAGMRPDAALAFLVAGGITSAWAAIPVFALVRLPVFAFYILLAVAGSVLAGWLSGFYLL